MKRTVWLWSLVGFAIAALGGTLLHFLYDWLGQPIWIAPFSGVNESTFEHMKLLFWPMLIFAVIESFFFGGYDSFFCVKLRSLLIGVSLIPLLFYTYNGIIGKSPDFVNIAIFFVSAAVAFIYEARALKNGTVGCKNPLIPIIILCIMALVFILFTFFPPNLAIFQDPLSGAFG